MRRHRNNRYSSWVLVVTALVLLTSVAPGQAAGQVEERSSELTLAAEGLHGSVQATGTLTLMTPMAHPGDEIRFTFQTVHEGTIEVPLCKASIAPVVVRSGCGVIEAHPPTKKLSPDDVVTRQQSYLGRAGTDVSAYGYLASGERPSAKVVRLDRPRGEITQANEVSTTATPSHYGRVQFRIVSSGELTFTVPEDAPDGDYALLFKYAPPELILSLYACAVCPGLPWWQKGRVPSFLLTTGNFPPTFEKEVQRLGDPTSLNTELYGDGEGRSRSFVVAQIPGLGLVRACFFIKDRSLGSGPSILGTSGKGDERSFEPFFHPSRCRVVIYINYEDGTGVVRSNPSCLEWKKCGEASDPHLTVSTVKRTGAVTAKYSFRSSLKMGHTFPAPRISGTLILTPQPAELARAAYPVELTGRLDLFPSVEIYQDIPGSDRGTICLFRQDERSFYSLFNAPWIKRGTYGTGKGCF